MAAVSAPGKILWIGGYAVLERPSASYVTGVDKRVYAKAEKREDGKVSIKCPQYGVDVEGTIDEKSGDVSFSADADVQQVENAKFVRKAIELSCAVLAFQGEKITGVAVETRSDEAFGAGKDKSGLGSSAAVTVATVGAVLLAYGKPVAENVDLIHRISQTSHSLVQGKVGSGFDVAAACFGGCKYVRYSPEVVKNIIGSSTENIVNAINGKWDYVATPVKLPDGLWMAIASFEGESASTSEMVKKVHAWKAMNSADYAALMKKLNESNEKAIDALEKNSLQEFKKFFAEGRALTKELGEKSGAPIEPSEYTKLIEESEGNGAFVAKLPGAGGGDAIAALCTSRQDKERLENFWKNYAEKKLRVLNLQASNEGVRKEE